MNNLNKEIIDRVKNNFMKPNSAELRKAYDWQVGCWVSWFNEGKWCHGIVFEVTDSVLRMLKADSSPVDLRRENVLLLFRIGLDISENIEAYQG